MHREKTTRIRLEAANGPGQVADAPLDGLRESEARFRALVDSAPVAIVIVDGDGRIRQVNSRTEEMFGYARDALIGKAVEALVPADRRGVHEGQRDSFLAAPHARPMGMGLDLEGLRSDGTTFPVEVGLGSAEFGGSIQGIAFITDITERKRSEQAVQNERSRLARDLHDAVTQSLFSATLIAEVLPRLWDRDEDEGRRRLDELRGLTRGALAEMRMLLMELRPGALAEAPLPELLRQLTDAASNRAGMAVHLAVDKDAGVPSEVRVAFYRCAQEALNNATRHSEATTVYVRLTQDETTTTIQVEDDGIGFQPESADASHFGLRIMRERALDVGADLEVDSAPGFGSRIKLRWPGRQPRSAP